MTDVQAQYALTGQSLGRPTEYTPDCVALALGFADQVPGATIAELACTLGVSKVTVYAWARTHPAFLNALEIFRAKSESYLAKRIREAKQADINAMFLGKVMHGWNDRQQDAGDGDKKITVEVLIKHQSLPAPQKDEQPIEAEYKVVRD